MDFLAGMRVSEIPNQGLHAAGTVGANPRRRIAVLQFRRAEPIQELIRIKRRLVDVLIIDQSEAAVKGSQRGPGSSKMSVNVQ